MTATLKESIKAPSIQGEVGNYIIIPDIMAVDKAGNGWCFEVKDEASSSYKMKSLRMTKGYKGPVWFLERRKANSYLKFSQAFQCPCIIAIGGSQRWKLGFLTQKSGSTIEYNRDIAAVNWNDSRGIPLLFNVMFQLEAFFNSAEKLRDFYWK